MLTLSSLTFRPARVEETPTLARLFQYAADGVVDYIWTTLQPEYPGLTPVEIGALRYAQPDNVFGYRNALFAELGGQVVGMAVSFPIAPDVETDPSADSAEPGDPVLAPYGLEEPDSWYLCALAVFPEFRGQGIGQQLIDRVFHQARSQGYRTVSLLCFGQNAGALRLYQRLGFQERDRTAVVPHPLIHHTGDILLMVAPV